MKHIVERTFTEAVSPDGSGVPGAVSQPLSSFEKMPAYVLLGEPGAGKTTSFKEAARPADAEFVTAGDLITYTKRPEWRGKTLFIDGLDEIRAGQLDARTPFDKIRSCLDDLGCPAFRLSCREADWLGAVDREKLRSVSPDGEIRVLHIDPLTEEDIVEILRNDRRVENVEKFISWSKSRNLFELISNPLVLDLFIVATENDKWPDSRTQAYEMACRALVREHNDEHNAAKRSCAVSLESYLEAAGFLCALLLISQIDGYALPPAAPTQSFPELNSLALDEIETYRDVLQTKLFEGVGRREPIHRQVAEFLAARCIAMLVEKSGLPIGRVLALITGNDGIVVAQLRGLSAWLAVLCKSHRSAIFERDPLGVVLYGDVQSFSTAEKKSLLNLLHEEAKRHTWFRSADWSASPFGALATSDMEAEFGRILSSSDRSEAHQALILCVLDAMVHGVTYQELIPTLEDVVRNSAFWLRIRSRALDVASRYRSESPKINGILVTLLDEITRGAIEDSEDELAGKLLTDLYPQTVVPANVLEYLHLPKRDNLSGSYLDFWRRKVLERSRDEDIAALLDQLVERSGTLPSVLEDSHSREFVSALLAIGLPAHGESIAAGRLFDWLRIGTDDFGMYRARSDSHVATIRSWLKSHPKVFFGLFDVGLARCKATDDFRSCMFVVERQLFHRDPPIGFGRWCFDRLASDPEAAEGNYLLQEVMKELAYRPNETDLSLELVQKAVKGSARLESEWRKIRFPRSDKEEMVYQKKAGKREALEVKKKEVFLHYVQAHRHEIREGKAHPHLLHQLAMAYFGRYSGMESGKPTECLSEYLDGDGNLVQVVLEGLRNSVSREDLPTTSEITQHYVDSQRPLLGLPFLAGMDQIARMSSDEFLGLEENQLRRALGFQLIEETSEPYWHQLLLEQRPKLVADVMAKQLVAAIRGGKRHIKGTYALAFVERYAQVAKFASLPMLKAFPVRCTSQQTHFLGDLLKAGLRHGDRTSLLALVQKKLGLRSMNGAQRVLWLAIGMVINADRYLQPLIETIEGKETRVRQLAGFLADRQEQWSPVNEFSLPVLGTLIRCIGQFFSPYTIESAEWATPAMDIANFISRLIHLLASRPSSEASDLLDGLSSHSDLSAWHSRLKGVRFSQRAVRREAEFQVPSLNETKQVLSNQAPANAGDLAALLIVLIRDLANRIRNNDTDDYLQYWNEAFPRKPAKPKHEDACRDALLSDMKSLVAPLGIEAIPEGHYAEDKRADIRVSLGGAGGFEVPIEIKKNLHRNLWRAIHDQLIPLYTREPRARGFGIYLVFWFGTDKTVPPPEGSRPKNATELEARLRATLSPDEKRKISICVVDVSKPE